MKKSLSEGCYQYPYQTLKYNTSQIHPKCTLILLYTVIPSLYNTTTLVVYWASID